jgi:hypothetical protein
MGAGGHSNNYEQDVDDLDKQNKRNDQDLTNKPAAHHEHH